MPALVSYAPLMFSEPFRKRTLEKRRLWLGDLYFRPVRRGRSGWPESALMKWAIARSREDTKSFDNMLQIICGPGEASIK